MIIKIRPFCILVFLFCGICAAAQTQLPDGQGFASAKPHVWWFLDNMHERGAKLDVTEAAITRDLEGLAEQGVGGFYVYSYGGMADPNPAWRAKMRFAFKEAHRLGLEGGLVLGSGGCCATTNLNPELAQQELVHTRTPVEGGKKVSIKLPRGKSKYSKFLKSDGSPVYYHDIAVFAVPEYAFDKDGRPTHKPVPPESIHILTDKLNATTDTLTWQAPAGRWIVVRLAHTPRLKGYTGYFIDHLSRKAMKAHWTILVQPFLDEMTPDERKGLRSVLCDSWEAGTVNWTSGYEQLFRKRRGYEITSWLPALAGVTITDAKTTARFKRDHTLTLSELLNENHYRYTTELAHANGMISISEAAGPHQKQSDMAAATVESDIAMGEFWLPSSHRPSDAQRFMVRDAASAAHIYGMKVVFAEAYTTIGTYWTESPFYMKSSTDRAFCDGLNQICYHGTMLSPSLTEMPGRTRFAGMHYNPQITWWKHSGAFNAYLTRCSERLQRGRFVADALLYHGDGFGMFAGLKTPEDGLGCGYDYDFGNTELLLRSRVERGEIVLPSGMRYKVLILSRKNPRDAQIWPGPARMLKAPLPRVDHPITLATLLKIKSLLEQGATVVGSRPIGPAGLVDDPAAFDALVTELWGKGDEKVRKVGKGVLITRKDNALIRETLKLEPDFSCKGESVRNAIDWIHRKEAGVDTYFVANLSRRAQRITAQFRAAAVNASCSVYDAVTDRTVPLSADKGGYVLELPPCGSCFVTMGENSVTTKTFKSCPEFDGAGVALTNGWTLFFDPQWGGPGTVQFETLKDWTADADIGIRYYSGTVVYRTHFILAEKVYPQLLDLGVVHETAEVFLNGQRQGVAWMRPALIDVSGGCKPGRNELEVRVANLWPNRLIRDAGLPLDQQLTQTNINPYKPNDPLRPSGLLGPVRLRNYPLPGEPFWDTSPPVFSIDSARYEARDGSKGADVTEIMRGFVADGSLPIMVNNRSIGFDPARGKYKQLVVHYTFEGCKLRKCVPTGDMIDLP
ncbi:MAG: glycosyl hydrolase [Kiritimatiellae bacterium]|jgi:hypothetical protein|nr:glycosyl hydrolase [Kiritimatiellia bacterium]